MSPSELSSSELSSSELNAGQLSESRDLSRLLRPKSIAVVGGAWALNVVQQLVKTSFNGDIWPVHPSRDTMAGVACFKSLDDLPAAPDMCFVGVNRDLTIDVIGQLAAMGAGGASCFASGFLESESDVAGGAALQEQLVEAAGRMPMLGPNCYGYINYLDNVCLWPDEHGGVAVASGVAIIAQSSNVAISLTMQQRGLPIAYLLTAGNQAQTGIAELANTLLQDDRITAIGMYVEGFGNLRALEQTAELAKQSGKPIVVLKAGQSQAAQLATISHTASLAGSATASNEVLKRLGLTQVHDLDVFIETLKVLHYSGPLQNRKITSVSCSGGEAALMADCCENLELEFPSLSAAQRQQLADCLGPMVALANPLDYHTYIWSDVDAMTQCFSAACNGDAGLTIFVLDIPRTDRCNGEAWECAIKAIAQARQATQKPVAILASLAENMTEPLAQRLISLGCTPLSGMRTGLLAVEAAAQAGEYLRRNKVAQPLLLTGLSAPKEDNSGIVLNELDAKTALAEFNVPIPASLALANYQVARPPKPRAKDRAEDGGQKLDIPYPCVLKALGLAHKSEHSAVVLNIADQNALYDAAKTMAEQLANDQQTFMIEQMCGGTILELLVGITRDASGVLVLTVASGGTLTELFKDSASLLLPAGAIEIESALSKLKLFPLFKGFRGRPAANLPATVQAIESICAYAHHHAQSVLEVEVNPLIVREHDAIVVDALIRKT